MPMTFSQFLTILRARIWILLGTLGVVLGSITALSLVLPKEYTAEATVVVDFKGSDPVLGVMLPVQLMPGYLATQMDIIESHKVALEVVRMLRIAESPNARESWLEATEGKGSIEDWYADLLLKKLVVKPSRESSVISIAFNGSDPRFAAVVANTFAQAYQKTNLELKVEPARQTAAWFDERLQALRKKLEQAQTRLSEYQRAKGFTAQDERTDLESARLAEISAQYTMAQAQAADAQSRLRQLSDFLARGASPETMPDVLANPLIQNLKSQLTQTESRLQQTSSQLGRNHPEVRRLEADIESQRGKLKTEISAAASSIRNSANIAQRREADLRATLAEQKAKLIKLNSGRDEFQVLMKEVDNAQKAFDVASQRFQQTNLESQASQTNIAVLSPAVPPIEASFPRLTLNLLLGLIVGIVLAVVLALIVEFIDRRVRSPKELADIMQAPMLGVLLDDAADTKRRRRSLRRAERSGKDSKAQRLAKAG